MTKKSQDINYISKDLFPKSYRTTMIDDMYKQLQQENKQLKEKYNRALKQLIEYATPCEIDDFNIRDDYCSKHCGVDEETYLKCWDRFIEQELEKKSDK